MKRQRTIRGCARCHGEGHTLEFEELVNPSQLDNITVTEWAMCPVTNQPIWFGVRRGEPLDHA